MEKGVSRTVMFLGLAIAFTAGGAIGAGVMQKQLTKEHEMSKSMVAAETRDAVYFDFTLPHSTDYMAKYMIDGQEIKNRSDSIEAIQDNVRIDMAGAIKEALTKSGYAITKVQ